MAGFMEPGFVGVAVEGSLRIAASGTWTAGYVGALEQIIDDIPRRFEALILPLAADGVVVNMLLAAVLCRDDRSDT